VWMAEDTAATIPTTGLFNPNYADALALPLKAGGKPLAALHLYKASGFFSDKDRQFVEAVAHFAAQGMSGLKARRGVGGGAGPARGPPTDGAEGAGGSPGLVALRGH